MSASRANGVQPVGALCGRVTRLYLRVRRSSSRTFKLAAPRDLNGPDPQLKEEFQEIRGCWAKVGPEPDPVERLLIAR